MKFQMQIPHKETHKKCLGPIPPLQQKVSHFDVWQHFSPIHAYFENYLVLELKHHSLHINSIIIFMPRRTKVMEIFQL